jgi:hypothetical protein
MNNNVIGNRLIVESAIQNQINSFSRGFPLPCDVETLQAIADSAILSEIFVL